MLQCNKNQAGLTAKSFGAGRITVPVFMLALSVMAAGCESVPDVVNPVKWFEDDHPQDAAEANKDFPNLGSVPDRPVAPTLESQQAEIREGLVSDQENARYTESEVQQESARRTGNAPLSAGPRIGAAQQRVAAPTVPSAPVPAQRAVQAPSLRASVPPPPAVVRPVPAPVAPPTVRSVPAAVPPPPQIARVPVAVPPPPPVAVPAPTVRTPVPPRPSVAPPVLVPQTAVAAPRQAPQLAAPAKVATIYFADNSKSLQPADVRILEQVAAAQRSTGSRIRITGHASGRARTFDSDRRSRINFEVSSSRANAVASALVSLGVPRNRIAVEALGDSAPVYAEYTAAGEAANRRAEIWMIN